MTILTKFEQDALKELENIGSGNAATALSKMLRREVQISVPGIHIVSLKKLEEKISNHQKLVVVLYTPVTGDLTGNVVSIFFSKEEALNIADLLQKRKVGTSEILTEMDQSALKELGDILAGSFLTAVSNFLSIRLERSYQRLAYLFGDSIIDLMLLDINKNLKHALLISTNFNIPNIMVGGEFTMMVSMKSLPPLLTVLKKKMI